MTNGTPTNEHDAANEPSDYFLSLIQEIDAALHEGRIPQLSEQALHSLSEFERARLERTHRQMLLRYAQSHRQRMRHQPSASTVINGNPGLAADDDTFDVSPELQPFLGIEGTKFGRFEVLRGLGMGGHGVVFLARDPILDRLVALKVPRPEVLINPSHRKRFLAEGRAAALLTHPNIVSVFESGEVGSICYLVQDYVSGPSLAEWLHDNPHPEDCRVSAEIILHLAEAVALAHSRLILHRDIKPGNILFAPKSCQLPFSSIRDFVPKLSDFGMAKLLQGQDQTQSGGILGTPAYMSPEQAAGRQDLVGVATDIYSLGAVLYELLTHRQVHHGNTDLDTLHQVMTCEPKRLRPLVPGLSPDLEAICLKCLQREPQDRYLTAQELAEDLRRFLGGQPVVARPQSLWTTAYKWCRRNPVIAGLLSAIVATVLMMLGISLRYNARLNESLRAVNESNLVAEQSNVELNEANSRLRNSLDTVRQQEQKLREQTMILRRRVYTDDLNLAARAWANSDMEQCALRLKACIPQADAPDFRSFPWWFLWRLSQETTQVWGQHAGGVSAVAINKSGTLAATAGLDGIIRLWKIPDGTLVGELTGHAAKDINALDFASGENHRLLVSAGDDGTVRIWDTDSVSLRQVLSDHNGWVATARFLGLNSEAIATGGEDKVIRIWNTQSGELLREIVGHTDIVRELCEISSHHLLISTSEDRTVRVWDWQTGTSDTRLPGGKLPTRGDHYARSVSCNANETVLAGGFRDGKILLWNLRSDQFGDLLHESNVGMAIRSLSWRNADSLLVTAENLLLLAVNAAIGDFSWQRFQGHAEKVMAAAAPANSNGCLSADRAGTIRWWPKNILDGDAQIASDIIVSPIQWNDSVFVTTAGNGGYLGFSNPTLKPVFQLQLSNPGLWGQFCVSPDGKMLLTTQRLEAANYFASFSTMNKETYWQIPLPSKINSCSISPDGSMTCICLNGEAWLVDSLSGQKRMTLIHSNNFQHAIFLQNPSQLITACADGWICVWDIKTGEKLREWRAHRDSISLISLSPDHQLLATCAEDHKARVWSFADGAEVASFTLDMSIALDHDQLILIEFLDDGATLAIGTEAKLMFFSVPDQLPLAYFDDMHGITKRVAFSPDRKTIAIQNGRKIRLVRGAP